MLHHMSGARVAAGWIEVGPVACSMSSVRYMEEVPLFALFLRNDGDCNNQETCARGNVNVTLPLR
jgi:hypothetical protein